MFFAMGRPVVKISAFQCFPNGFCSRSMAAVIKHDNMGGSGTVRPVREEKRQAQTSISGSVRLVQRQRNGMITFFRQDESSALLDRTGLTSKGLSRKNCSTHFQSSLLRANLTYLLSVLSPGSQLYSQHIKCPIPTNTTGKKVKKQLKMTGC